MDQEVSLLEVIRFLNDDRPYLKKAALKTIAELTGTTEGVTLISRNKDLLKTLLELIYFPDEAISKTSFKILVNISAEESGACVLYSLENISVLEVLINCIHDCEYCHAEYACGVLANISRISDLCSQIIENLNDMPVKLEDLVSILCQIGYNKKGESLDLLASVISNFTQIQIGRRAILNKEKCILTRLLPFINYKESKLRRNAIVSAVHNCCFEKEYHEWLLSDDVDLASYLAYPLAGPDSFTEEENEILPFDLQFLPEDKCREENPEIRALLLESLMQLCTTKKCRERLRNLNIYLVLREHHKWETNQRCLVLNEDIVNLLIKTEDEIGEDDLSDVKVPAQLIKKFTEFDENTLQE